MVTSIDIAYITTNDQKGTSKISYINPDATKATDELLVSLAKKLMALTTNEYTGLSKTDKKQIE